MGSNVKYPLWRKSWLLDILFRLGFVTMLAWVAINLVLRLVPEEGIVLTITTGPARAVPSPAPCPE